MHSIAAVSKLTGVSCHTLRVWERRYGFPIPERSASGHRRYSHDQVQKLRQLALVVQTSREPIAEVIRRLKLEAPSSNDLPAMPAPISNKGSYFLLLHKLVAGDCAACESEFDRLSQVFEPAELIERVIHPLLVEAGEGWFRKEYHVFHERLITVFLRRKLAELIDIARRKQGQPSHEVVAGTVQGDRHEGGVMMFNYAMEVRGWRVHNMGVDLPVVEYRAAVAELRPSALALSFVLSRNIKKRFQELETIRSVPVFVGGRSIINYQSLARNHGLIPLPGSINSAADQFVAEYQIWCRHKGRAL
jgi:DNA-binding transcriptional MerR regulator